MGVWVDVKRNTDIAHCRFRSRYRDTNGNKFRRQQTLNLQRFRRFRSRLRETPPLLIACGIEPVVFDTYATTKCHHRKPTLALNLKHLLRLRGCPCGKFEQLR